MNSAFHLTSNGVQYYACHEKKVLGQALKSMIKKYDEKFCMFIRGSRLYKSTIPRLMYLSYYALFFGLFSVLSFVVTHEHLSFLIFQVTIGRYFQHNITQFPAMPPRELNRILDLFPSAFVRGNNN